MAKKKSEAEPESWSDKLMEALQAEPAPSCCPVVPEPKPLYVPSPEATEAMARALAAEARARRAEIKALALERDLYLTKAKLLDLELQKLMAQEPQP